MKLSEKIQEGKILISDGAWGTMLQKKGLDPEKCAEEWNITHRDKVLELAWEYISAGADIIKTNSFGANRCKLENYGLQEKVYEINGVAAQISREAAGADIFVLGSIGPTGKILMTQEISETEMYNAFKEQAQALEEGGANAILIETMYDLSEALLAVQAAKDNTDPEVICTMTFDSAFGGDYFNMMGVIPEAFAMTLVDAEVDMIGSNCGKGIADMVEIARKIRSKAKNIPLVIHANAGIPVYKEGKIIYPESPEYMASFIPDLIDAGVNIFGGCCGTTPEHIREFARKVHDR